MGGSEVNVNKQENRSGADHFCKMATTGQGVHLLHTSMKENIIVELMLFVC